MTQTPIANLSPDPDNARKHDDKNIEAIKRSLQKFGQQKPIVVNADGVIVAGNGTFLAARAIGWTDVDVVVTELDKPNQKAFAIADNRTAELAAWDVEMLAVQVEELKVEMPDFDVGDIGFDSEGLSSMGDGGGPSKASGVLAERFLFAPFTVLDSRRGEWMNRKRTWVSMGISGAGGRGGNLGKYSKTMSMAGAGDKALTFRGANDEGDAGDAFRERGGGTSIFDPVLAELAIRWWCPKGGQVVDPFCGGAVRGIVSSYLQRPYWGCDLRQEQIDHNEAQIGECLLDLKIKPDWVVGDSVDMLADAPLADFILSCPPYGDLEKYSDEPGELSAMGWEGFLSAYVEIISLAVARLKDDRFACFVVGDFRGEKTMSRGFVSETIQAFKGCGLGLYNEAILVNSVGTACMRASQHFPIGRKLTKVHQNVLVFCKGNWKKAVEACGDVEVGSVGMEVTEDVSN